MDWQQINSSLFSGVTAWREPPHHGALTRPPSPHPRAASPAAMGGETSAADTCSCCPRSFIEASRYLTQIH